MPAESGILAGTPSLVEQTAVLWYIEPLFDASCFPPGRRRACYPLGAASRMDRNDLNDHQLLALWAADCAEHVLATFADASADDDRPRAAIAAARDWVRGVLRMPDARSAAFAAHAAARDTNCESARFAARAAGHAAATAHVADHAQHAAGYALKAVSDVDIERDWQRKHLATHLQPQFFPAARAG